MLYFFIFLPLIIGLVLFVFLMMQDRLRTKKLIVSLSRLDVSDIIDKQQKLTSNKHHTPDFNLKLIQSGITLKEYNEAKFLFVIIGIIIGVVLPFFLSFTLSVVAVLVAILMIVFSGEIYLSISKSERVEKINNDLGVFLDLINVILEAGGSLKNAFFQVSNKAHGIICEDLLKEIAILEYEMTNYSTKKAYENLKLRVDSSEMDKIVDFLILSEETGIGVKNVFSMQSDEMRKEKFYKIKGKVSTLNMYLMIVIFIFVLPALGAFIVFPMMAGKISFGL
jgi:tight adherence protein C